MFSKLPWIASWSLANFSMLAVSTHVYCRNSRTRIVCQATGFWDLKKDCCAVTSSCCQWSVTQYQHVECRCNNLPLALCTRVSTHPIQALTVTTRNTSCCIEGGPLHYCPPVVQSVLLPVSKLVHCLAMLCMYAPFGEQLPDPDSQISMTIKFIHTE